MRKEELIQVLGYQERNFINYRGYDLLIQDFQQNYLTYPVITFRFNGKLKEEQIKVIKANLKGVGGLKVDNPSYIAHILCTPLAGKIKEDRLLKFKEAFDALISVLENEGIKTLSTCVICKKVDGEVLEDHIVNDKLVLTHAHCYEEYKNSVLQEVSKNEGNKKAYPVSILFAIIGAALGYLAFLIVALISNILFGALFLAIPYLAYRGYKLGKAPLNKMATGIIIAISIIVMLVGIADTFGFFVLPLEEILASEAVGDILFCLIFGFIGIGYSVKIISKDNNENKVNKLQ